jgi:hypothetical protein
MCKLVEVNWFKLNIKAYQTTKLGVYEHSWNALHGIKEAKNY